MRCLSNMKDALCICRHLAIAVMLLLDASYQAVVTQLGLYFKTTIVDIAHEILRLKKLRKQRCLNTHYVSNNSDLIGYKTD